MKNKIKCERTGYEKWPMKNRKEQNALVFESTRERKEIAKGAHISKRQISMVSEGRRQENKWSVGIGRKRGDRSMGSQRMTKRTTDRQTG